MKQARVISEVKLRVRVRPRARKNVIVGADAGILKVHIAAPPVGGAANRQLEKYLAKTLGIDASQVNVASGRTSRWKTVKIVGVKAESLRDRLFQKPGTMSQGTD